MRQTREKAQDVRQRMRKMLNAQMIEKRDQDLREHRVMMMQKRKEWWKELRGRSVATAILMMMMTPATMKAPGGRRNEQLELLLKRWLQHQCLLPMYHSGLQWLVLVCEL